jgi:hypothetical protein
MKKFSPLSLLVAVALAGTPMSVLAHDGHGNSIWHAVLHMIEDNGLLLAIAFVAIVASLRWRAKLRSRSSSPSPARSKIGKENDHDSR